ncbi:uncharacterized protein N7477_009692 [Penicillium maclennaniae]|uniref:uncharacterized protein n=1 Tax=Penicillium maclennaniae TaxID=1343394 RepID=UPI0025417F6B|nr:uncharacterized protein N7477_009692 [Penicillium maclennaniae]KAJ5662076.1 hypothetical protein N7477_009692 [Penicillium maclennaniae]
MFRVELLPDSGAAAQPGWTYVADRGFDPSKAAMAPTLGRKRGIRDAGKGGDISSRRANAIVRHLAELDRENQRDVQISIPVKQAKEAGSRGTRAKTTSNVRRILQSQKTFRNHLDDEEAAIAAGGGGVSAALGSGNMAAATAKSRAAAVAVARRSSTPASTPASKKRTAATVNAASTPTPAPSQIETTDAEAENADDEPKPKLIKTEYDNDPLLRSFAPTMPSERIMQRLLAEPPLPTTLRARDHQCPHGHRERSVACVDTGARFGARAVICGRVDLIVIECMRTLGVERSSRAGTNARLYTTETSFGFVLFFTTV